MCDSVHIMVSKAQSTATLSTGAPERKEMTPGRELYIAVRQGLVGKETSLNAWCEANGLSRGKVQAALFGYSNSHDAKDIRRRAMIAAGLIAPDAPTTEAS